METYHGPGATEGRHGYDGPIHISSGTYNARRSEDDFIAAAKVLGYPEIVDIMDLDSNNGVQRSMRFISPDGKRQDTAHMYLHPRLNDGKHPNLHVLVESKVIRVLFDNKKAIGVEFQPLAQDGVKSVRARKMVIVSSGALGTPSVLERSGVGNAEILQRAGIDVVANIPGVGENYSDHHLLIYPYRTSLSPNETVDGLVSGRVDPAELIKNHDKVLGWNAMDITGKYRPTESEVDSLGPTFRKFWDRDFKNNQNKPLALMSLINT